MQQIRNNLHIGDARIVRQLPSYHDFDEVVALGYAKPLGLPEHTTTGEKFVFPDEDNAYETFRAAVNHVINAVSNGQKTLVYSRAGISRAGGVCAVTVSELNNTVLTLALSQVQDARNSVYPSPEIQRHMERYTGDTIYRKTATTSVSSHR